MPSEVRTRAYKRKVWSWTGTYVSGTYVGLSIVVIFMVEQYATLGSCKALKFVGRHGCPLASLVFTVSLFERLGGDSPVNALLRSQRGKVWNWRNSVSRPILAVKRLVVASAVTV